MFLYFFTSLDGMYQICHLLYSRKLPASHLRIIVVIELHFFDLRMAGLSLFDFFGILFWNRHWSEIFLIRIIVLVLIDIPIEKIRAQLWSFWTLRFQLNTVHCSIFTDGLNSKVNTGRKRITHSIEALSSTSGHKLHSLTLWSWNLKSSKFTQVVTNSSHHSEIKKIYIVAKSFFSN